MAVAIAADTWDVFRAAAARVEILAAGKWRNDFSNVGRKEIKQIAYLICSFWGNGRKRLAMGSKIEDKFLRRGRRWFCIVQLSLGSH